MAGFADAQQLKIDAATGKVRWASRVFPVGQHQAINSAPRVWDGKVFIGTSGAEFGVRGQVAALPADGYWQGMAKTALNDDLAGLQRQITGDALKAGGAAEWERSQSSAIGRARRMLAELADSRQADLAMLSVALRELRSLA